MKDLAELAYSLGGWWIWFEVYGVLFSITHYPDEDEDSIWIDPCNVVDLERINSIDVLGDFIRSFCDDAPLDDEAILSEVKMSIWKVITH